MRNGSRLPHKSGECLLATTTPVHSAQTIAFWVEYSVFILTHPPLPLTAFRRQPSVSSYPSRDVQTSGVSWGLG